MSVTVLTVAYTHPSFSYVQDRFVRLVNTTTLPVRQSPDYAQALRKLHAAILGICAIVDSFPYTVERWMPELLTDVLAEHTYDPVSLFLFTCYICKKKQIILGCYPFLPRFNGDTNLDCALYLDPRFVDRPEVRQ